MKILQMCIVTIYCDIENLINVINLGQLFFFAAQTKKVRARRIF